MKYRPRHDNVLVRVHQRGVSPGGIAVPQMSIEGKDYIVEAIGPDVEDLSIGDSVLMTGKLGVEYYPLPNVNDMICIKEENVVLVLTDA